MAEGAKERVYGVEVAPLLDGEMAHEVIVVTKVLTPDGDSALSIRHSDGLNSWDRIGLLTAALDRARFDAGQSWRSDSHDLDDD